MSNTMKYMLANWRMGQYPIRNSFKVRPKVKNRLRRSLKRLVKNRMFKDLDKE